MNVYTVAEYANATSNTQFFSQFISTYAGKISRCPYRAATEYYVPEIGYQLYRMLYALKLDLRSLNCIGHSLGSHIVRIQC